MTIGKTDHLHHMFIWFKPWPGSLVVVSNKTIKVCKYFYYIKMNLLHIFEYITKQPGPVVHCSKYEELTSNDYCTVV